MATQNIQLSTVNSTIIPGTEFDVGLIYNVSDGDNTLTGLGLRLHYDSTKLEFVSSNSLIPSFGAILDGVDTNNNDNDAITDRRVTLQYVDPTFGNNWPNQALPLTLATVRLRAKTTFSTNTSLKVSFSDTAVNYTGLATPLTINANTNQAPAISIIDNSGTTTDRAIAFNTITGNTAIGFTTKNLVRPAFADRTKFIDITNTGTGVLDISGIQINAQTSPLTITLVPRETSLSIPLPPDALALAMPPPQQGKTLTSPMV
ncbi:MAG: hypothetical protein HC796_10125 [Synechococcaceae cyanobacterium RL_1_2]|nr:hypothetical protein [Synechococcaceae cyanobacterium RL_1_2]